MHMNLPECDDNGHALGGDGGGLRGRGQGGGPDEEMRAGRGGRRMRGKEPRVIEHSHEHSVRGGVIS